MKKPIVYVAVFGIRKNEKGNLIYEENLKTIIGK